jgi:hypothetical protein
MNLFWIFLKDRQINQIMTNLSILMSAGATTDVAVTSLQTNLVSTTGTRVQDKTSVICHHRKISCAQFFTLPLLQQQSSHQHRNFSAAYYIDTRPL